MNTMKTKFFAERFVVLCSTLAAGLILQGCATTTASSREKQALVCPQCKMVDVETYQPEIAQQTTTQEHRCPGCQGVLMNFLHQGKLEHKCSICGQKPFVCPVVHPSA